MCDVNLQRCGFSASIRHLKVFESVVRLHGLGRASEECHLTQPAITQALKKLEGQIGVALLRRCGTGSYVNEFGAIFYRRAERFFAQVELALHELGVAEAPVPLRSLASRISQAQIRSLLAIVEHGSSAHAARGLGLSHATLQRAARELERTLRVPLYARTASGIVAMPEAAEFARRVKVAQREIDQGIDEIEAARGSSGAEIAIGAMNMAGSVLLGSVINDFVLSNRTASVRIVNGNAKELLIQLRSGDVDAVIGLLREPGAEDLIQLPLAETPYVVVARQGHPLLQRQRVALEDIAAYEWVIGNRDSTRRLCFDTLFAGRCMPPTRIETSSLPTIRLLLSQGDRLALLTSYELMHEEDALGSVPYGPIAPAPSIGLTLRKDWLPTALQASFIERIQKLIGESLLPAKSFRGRETGPACRQAGKRLAAS
jgi:LysR family transcriptional regulator, regulator for genes of the gallate degradation pathway